MRSKLALFALGVALSLCASAEDFVWDSRVRHGQLENGFSYYIVKDKGSQVSMQLLVRVGSLDERDNQSGVAHMVEHMVFHATTGHPQGLRTYMESQGWRIGKHYNAQTNFDRTLYQLALDKRPERISAGLTALSEIAGGAQIPAEGLERERQIIREEWRTKLGVRERMEKQRRAMLREGSLYPQRPTIGTERSIAEQPAASLRQFYADWYRPGNMALIVVGNVDEAQLQADIRARFGTLKPGTLPARNAADPHLREQLRIVRLQDAESGGSQVGWVNRFAVNKEQNDAGLRDRIIDRIAERSLRTLVRQVAENLPSGVESLTSSKGELGESTASLGLAASVAVDGHQAGLQQILLLRQRVLSEGLRAQDIRAEIDEVRRLNEKGPAQQAARDFSGWVQMLGEAVQAERVLQDPVQKQAQIRQILAALSADDINARARSWINAPDRVLFMMAPGLSPLALPSVAEVGAMQRSVASTSLPALVTTKAAPAPEVVPVRMPGNGTTGNITKQEDIGQGAQRWTLSNGDILIWRHAPQDTLTRFVAQSGAGYRLPGAPSWQWQLAAQLGQNADLNGQAEGDLRRWTSERKLNLSQQHSETQLSYSAQAEPAKLAELLQLYAARQTLSDITMTALNGSGRQLARQSARRPDSVNERMSAEMAKLRYGALPQDGYPDAGAVRALMTPAGLQAVRQQWRDISSQPATYFVSSPADPGQVKELAARYLAGIPRQAAAHSASPLLQAAGYHESRLEIGIEPQGSLRVIGSQQLQWSPERAMRTAILSRIVYRQLRQELREKEAGIYRLSYKLTLEPGRNRLSSELSFTAAPERLDTLWAAARRVLERLPEQLDDAMLSEEIQQMRSDESKRAADSSAQFSRLQLSYAQYGDARYLDDSRQLTATLTPASVRALAQEFKLANDLAVVKLLPRPEVKVTSGTSP
ncbi:insulinase family protein [Duganella sp. sic0402]|uniref:M16 family metallopeptidase n=1 Tax=Duganella sp. sic0402 TaxID=2854786 RepID=UPI001C48D893|nr:M16 family metallopeptidase [Duganella sp. sic0402]MBV7534936.1 insulinase family protein [Duganella sp. sic0402]